MPNQTAQYTPGDWTNELHASDGVKTLDCWTAEVRSVSRGLVAVAVGNSKEEAEANARLIAEAPSLLAALRTMVKEIDYVIEDGTFPTETRTHAAIRNAHATIARAEGRTP